MNEDAKNKGVSLTELPELPLVKRRRGGQIKTHRIGLQKTYKFALLVLVVSLVGLITTLSLVQQKQNLQSRANQPETLPAPPEGFYWELIWSDEFSGSTVDVSKWEIIGDEPRRDGWWMREDAYLDGQGHLILRTKRDNGRYTSGAVRTRGKFEHTFGYYEARVTFPSQEGHWPAFWLFSSSVHNVDGSGRDGTEIDIIEKPWTTDLVHQALHWDGYGEGHQSISQTEIPIPGISQGWHVAGLDWSTDRYVFYVDGNATWNTSAGGVSQVPQYIKLTEEVGEWWGNIENANLPDYFMVDYVRVYDLIEEVETDPGPTAQGTSEPTATPEIIVLAQCINIKAFDTDWKELSATELAGLSAGDTVRFTVAGTTNLGSIDRARFIINGVTRDVVTQKRPDTDEFYDEYTISEGTTNFSIKAQLNHSTSGWF